ncbi:hypothetical protein BJX63DRAFT_421727 [Aspergillus granulosus]|uniref:Uncharacterized protein n=1 Tax=Aspergillus granulosus TaxID=176169 RepID=A0ABR4HB93_9EURO
MRPERTDCCCWGLCLWKYHSTYRTTRSFQQHAQFFYYKNLNGTLIPIDMTPDWQSPYLPSAAVPISAVNRINSYGLRSTFKKQLCDANDAELLAFSLSSRGPIVLSSTQKIIVLQGLDGVVQCSTMDGTWWKITLGLS